MSAEIFETLGTPETAAQTEEAARETRRAIATARALRAALGTLGLPTYGAIIIQFPLGISDAALGVRVAIAATFWSVGTFFIFIAAIALSEQLCRTEKGLARCNAGLATTLMVAAAAAAAWLSDQPAAPLAAFGAAFGVLLNALIAACIWLERAKTRRDGLKPLKPEDCPEVLAACQKDPEAESYRLAVARIKRPLTREEARRLHEWSVQAPSRQQRAERLRQQQVACCLLRSDEPLPMKSQYGPPPLTARP